MLHRISVTKYNDLSREEKRLFKYPNAQEAVAKLLTEIMRRTMEYKVLSMATPIIICIVSTN